MLPLVTFEELRRNLIAQEGPVRMQYNTRDQYKRITRMLGLMDDFKVGTAPKTHHLPATLMCSYLSLTIIEWRATYRIPRHCIVLLQQTSRAPSAECQLEGLRSIVELTALASIRLPIVINAPRAPPTANQTLWGTSSMHHEM